MVTDGLFKWCNKDKDYEIKVEVLRGKFGHFWWKLCYNTFTYLQCYNTLTYLQTPRGRNRRLRPRAETLCRKPHICTL